MLSDEIRRRLQALNRQALPAVRSAISSPPAARFQRIDGPHPQRPLFSALEPAPQHERTDALQAASQCENSSGKHLRLIRPLAQFWPQGSAAIRRAIDARAAAERVEGQHPELAALRERFPHGILVLDLETCGFAGSPIFLVGLLRHADGELVLDQLLARSYAEERAILETLWQVAARSSLLVTFNGKSFDWPMVQDRTTRHRLGTASARPGVLHCDLPHCDLLHHARRRWRRLLPNCKLQTLERYICRRMRRDDLSGQQVPAAYHGYVRTGDTRQLNSILHHNALDLVTLLELGLRAAGLGTAATQ